MRIRAALAALFFVLWLSPAGLAVDPGEALADPELEARARALSKELRCVTCQSQSIDDSDAPLARDLRLIVRERLSQGDTDEEVIAFVVARYGDYVRLKPAFRGDTLILWLAPGLILITGGVIMIFHIRKMKELLKAKARADDENRRAQS